MKITLIVTAVILALCLLACSSASSKPVPSTVSAAPPPPPSPALASLDELMVLRIEHLNRDIQDKQFRLNQLAAEACGKASLKLEECQIDFEARSVSRKPTVVKK